MNVLVTGGAGYIGSHTVFELLNCGHSVVVYDNLSTGHSWTIDNIKEQLTKSSKQDTFCKLAIGDIRDKDTLTAVLDKYEKQGISFDGVIHFAGSSLVGESNINPEKYYENNVIGSKNLFDVLNAKNIKNIVFSSSCAVYGIPNRVPINEQEKKCPINTYGRTKLIVEQILSDYCNAYDMRAVALRYFNAAGALPQFGLGEAHEKETHIIPLALKTIFDKEKQFSVFGVDYETADGSCIRDYIHVRDLAAAHIKALERIMSKTSAKEAAFEAFNLGTGIGTSVLDIIKAIEAVAEVKVQTEVKERREGDPPVLVADNAKAENELGWTPKIKDIKQIIRDAYEWELIYRDMSL